MAAGDEKAAVLTRFAPSPTGRLHIGNARIALINWLYARRHDGRFLLRLDDTDAERGSEAYARGIEEDLEWLGLTRDDFARQSDRMARYEAAVERLKADGRLYPCYETKEELELKRRVAAGQGRPPIYDRAALALSEADRARLEAEGRQPHWRLRLEEGTLAWTDLVRGEVTFQAENLSDPVLVREDGRPLYTLTSVVDDLDLGVSDVIRGEDHVANTAVQIVLIAALDGTPPRFAHMPLMLGPQGEKLSKRAAGLSLEELRAQGIEPMAINNYLAGLGRGREPALALSLEDLAADFDISEYGRAAPRFDPDELGRANKRVLHETPYDAVAGRLRALGLDRADAAFWDAVRPNLAQLEEAARWHAVCYDAITPVIEDAEVCEAAARLLPDDIGEADVKAWTDSVKGETGRKGRALFHPLRLALTGYPDGPEIKSLLPLIGADKARARLRGERA